MKSSLTLKIGSFTASLMLLAAGSAIAQGPLTPPGAPGPTMKTLDQISTQISGISVGSAGRTALTVSSLETKNIGGASYYLVGNASGYIVINSDNTTLDLNGFKMTGLTSAGVPAITIAPGLRNIVIKNGTIDGRMSRALAASPAHPGNATYTPGVEGYFRGIDDDDANPVQGLVIENMVIRGCSEAGVDIKGSS
jgi:hypothetical protein